MLKFSIMLTAVSVSSLMACNGSSKDSKSKADSVNNYYDSTNNKKAERGDRAISGPDADFAVEAANGSLAEVELGKLAQIKSNNANIKAFGAMMIRDHAKAGAELSEIARAKRITLPASPGGEEQKVISDLKTKAGADFDKSYVEAMVKDHENDIRKFTDGRKRIHYQEFTAFIDSTLPLLKMHHQAALKLQQQFHR